MQVVLRRQWLRVADPSTDDVGGKIFGEFRLPGAAKVLEELRPALQAGPLDDSKQLGPQVGIRVAVPRDDILRPGFREVEALFQEGTQFGKQRNHTRFTTGMVHLKGMAELQWLYLRRTKVTDAGVADLQKSLPNCKIYQ